LNIGTVKCRKFEPLHSDNSSY